MSFCLNGAFVQGFTNGHVNEEFSVVPYKDVRMYKVVFTRQDTKRMEVEMGSFEAVTAVAAALRKDGYTVKVEKRED